jgi:hypothetical protein
MRVYGLTIGKNGLGPNVHELKADQESPTMAGEKWGRRSGRAGPTVVVRGHLSDFALALSLEVFKIGRPIVDRIGVQGTYIGFLHWWNFRDIRGRPMMTT